MTLPRLVSRRVSVIALIVALAAAALALGVVLSRPAAIRTTAQFIQGVPEGTTPVRLDTTLYLPASTPAPAILLAQGFGGSKTDLAPQARLLAQAGYVVLAYTARGFGHSGGLIHLDSPRYEVADASRLIDWLATQPQVQLDGPGDPRVAVAGASYGGALALMLAGTDPRVDAVAADITWNDLGQALIPNGVLKKQWLGYLFQAGIPTGRPASTTGTEPGCGRFAPDVCTAYRQLMQTGTPSPATTALLAASSPARVDAAITAPTLLTQGENDSLFGLGQADANARAIAARGTPVQVVWRQGGHDLASATGNQQAQDAALAWFNSHLRGQGAPSRAFDMARGGPQLSTTSHTSRWVGQTYQVTGGYPGIAGHPPANTFDVKVSGAATTISAPAGGVPAAISSVPGLGALPAAATAGGTLGMPPGQTATFRSSPLQQTTFIAGTPTTTLTITPATTTDATLFLALRDADPAGGANGLTLPAGLVAPVRLTGLTPGHPTTVSVRLPAIGYQVPAGHRLELTVATTDQAYNLPQDPRQYLVQAAGPVALPVVTVTAAGSAVSVVPWLVSVAIVVLLATVAALALRRRRARLRLGADPALADVPVAVQDLVKVYRDGFRAVDGVSFAVERGQVVGLLGPNGAGKTTALRVLMGLMRPTSGQIRVFGEAVLPGAPVLSRLGAFVEGAGFLPHLSGEQNLRLFWAATGRPPADAHVDVAIEIAGLGGSIERKVKTYSQGMRQRLALAQAMLGLPELLVLDEPTNGLDPPQIAEMREVLRRYADTGRTVLLSSHLLAEVEQTCSHVVVMHRGRVVAAGTVTDVAGPSGVQLAVTDPVRATRVLAGAGIAATAVPARRALEDVFLGLVGDRLVEPGAAQADQPDQAALIDDPRGNT